MSSLSFEFVCFILIIYPRTVLFQHDCYAIFCLLSIPGYTLAKDIAIKITPTFAGVKSLRINDVVYEAVSGRDVAYVLGGSAAAANIVYSNKNQDRTQAEGVVRNNTLAEGVEHNISLHHNNHEIPRRAHPN